MTIQEHLDNHSYGDDYHRCNNNDDDFDIKDDDHNDNYNYGNDDHKFMITIMMMTVLMIGSQ